MSTHKYIERICVVAVIFSLLLTMVFLNAESFGIEEAETTLGYEERLFDNSVVHTIDIQMDEWDSFIETCENEEYAVCEVVIDGEVYANVGIRAKGNTSLSSVSSMGSDRYSFKIEFDQYDSTKSYHGLDKLSLNNLIQDNTMMKDYLTYQMMAEFGVDAPLCSYTYITVNGEDWGLYLAVEGVEESFLERNYGNDYGELYKPDSMSFGGGRGNGQKFSMDDFGGETDEETAEAFNAGEMPEGFDASQMTEDFDPSTMFGGGGNMFSGMGSSDVKLQYIDDDPESYANIFDNAKTDITEADQNRLIESLKSLSENEDIESVVNVEEVIRYFVVHNFVCNDDSYTGAMIHNYYLYEEDGQMSMIPWDYNLAFGGFQSSDATSTVNEPIDTPVSDGPTEDRPMLNWIYESEEYTELYHHFFAEFLEQVDFAEVIERITELIAPYVEKDPSKFCTYEEFETGVSTLQKFCLLREASIEGQLDGTIPSTTEGQSADNSALVDASHIIISDMGTMGNVMGGGRDQGMTRPGNPEEEGTMPSMPQGREGTMPSMPQGREGTMPSIPQGGEGTMPSVPQGGEKEMPSMPQGNGNMPQMQEGMEIPEGIELPEGTEMPEGSVSMSVSGSNLILLVASVGVLIAGLVFAFKFKRYRHYQD